MTYPRRLIEVDLPIKEISAHARREKSIRHGHISTLHIWWARRPLAACRAVLCAALWPDPADDLCPQTFRVAASRILCEFAEKARTERQVMELVQKHYSAWNRTKPESLNPANQARWSEIRYRLLDFIADFANWDASTVPTFLETSRSLTQAAHEALGGATGTRPLVVDPFAGGGSIPLEALRVGADAFASDLNPVAVLLNKVVLEYIPKYGQRLADEVRKWGEWIKKEAEKELAEFYPKDPDGATPIAYLWARTIQCEGPGCGAEVPLMRSLWLAKKGSRSVALRIVPNPKEKRVDFEIIREAKPKDVGNGTVARGSATCPCCGYTTPVARVREQIKARHGGSNDAKPICLLTLSADGNSRVFRSPNSADAEVVARAKVEIERRELEHQGPLSLVPDEAISLNEIRRISVPIYGMMRWGDLFSPRQKLAFTVLTRLISQVGDKVSIEYSNVDFAKAVQAGLGCVLSKVLDRNTALARWEPNVQCSQQVFGRQAIAMVWDFGEPAIFVDCAGSWPSLLDVWLHGLINIISGATNLSERNSIHIETANAAAHPLPDDSADALVTDPPYYDAVPYSHLSDFFYVWQRRHLLKYFPDLFARALVAKDEEIVVDRPHKLSTSKHDIAFYERELTKAFSEGRRVVRPVGIGTIVFASKTTASWEAILKAVVDAGWIITGSWPIDTEMETRMNAMGTATLASSVHIVVRPRETPNGLLREDDIGDWREVLSELPKRIHDWMPRLAAEGVVGADAIFACLGPALEIFSRYSHVEKVSGEPVTLKEYLEHVWAAVSREALSLVFEGADVTGFEPDARLTAMWLWTLGSAVSGVSENDQADAEDNADDEEEEVGGKAKAQGGYTLEFDAARKIAQGLGARLEELKHVVEVKGDIARLLSMAERAKHLFEKSDNEAPTRKAAKKKPQLTLFAELEEVAEEQNWNETGAPKAGTTSLDRVHQSMLLFASGRGEALKRFLVDEGVGKQAQFWKLAQALSALYPGGSEEKRWVDGVLARKKGLGF